MTNSNNAEAFIERVRSLAPLARGSERRVAIRQKITESENIVRRDHGAPALGAFLQQARQQAAAEVTRNTRNNVATRTAEFFQEVSEELALRMRLTIRERDDDTFQVEINAQAAGGIPQVVKSGFYSLAAAREWIDSDPGNTLIKVVIEKYDK
jgi:hypothetical protein